jgi:hypothetical protein
VAAPSAKAKLSLAKTSELSCRVLRSTFRPGSITTVLESEIAMPSIVWERDPQEAYDQPYEYGAQEQFLREFVRFITAINEQLNKSVLCYHRDDRSLEKAMWMIAHDVVDALLEISRLLVEKRHRVASRMFRDCLENVDLLAVLGSGTQFSENALTKWYDNKTIPHRDSRQYLESIKGEDSAERRHYYGQLSKFTHRTYRALLHSYSLGAGNLLVHDSYGSHQLLVLPHVVAAYFAVLASLTVEASDALLHNGVLGEEVIMQAWSVALEADTVPRRFAIRRDAGEI